MGVAELIDVVVLGGESGWISGCRHDYPRPEFTVHLEHDPIAAGVNTSPENKFSTVFTFLLNFP